MEKDEGISAVNDDKYISYESTTRSIHEITKDKSSIFNLI